MSVWNILIISGVAGAALVAWGNLRFLWWLCAMFASYAISVIYWDLGWPRGEFVAGMCDIVIVAIMARKALYLWELWTALIVLTMAFINWLYLANNLTGAQLISHDGYSSVLEVLNIAAIVLIGGVASFDKAGMHDGVAFRPWLYVFGRMRHAYSRVRTRD